MVSSPRSGSMKSCLAAVVAGGVLCVSVGGAVRAASFPNARQNGGQFVAVQPDTTFRYRLGPGDQLGMKVFKMDGYEADVEVLSDGTINLPRIGTVSVWGLTLDEAKQLITRNYASILRRPLVYLDLRSPRPIKVTVTGDVTRPGVF